MTKIIEIFVDLKPGWQDDPADSLWFQNKSNLTEISVGWKRAKIVVELPCFGGSADVSINSTGKVDEVVRGPQFHPMN